MGGGMDLMPKITRADVLRARQAFRAVAEIPEWERIARDTFGDAEVDAPPLHGPASREDRGHLGEDGPGGAQRVSPRPCRTGG